jgi:xylulokinase
MSSATFLGLDLGTSELKAVLTNSEGRVVAQATSAITTQTPFAGASEQDPADWWLACVEVCRQLRVSDSASMDAVRAIGLSGHMHGATLLDQQGNVLRPCIMWNDNRSVQECAELTQSVPELGDIAGNLAMPGFTAPKLMWVHKHEPDVFSKTAKVLLPKDYLRYLLSGACVSEMSDAAGTLWLDVGKRDWSEHLLAATGLSRQHMPALVEGSDISGHLSAQAAESLGLRAGIPIAGGAGDNAASAIGIGATQAGDAFVSLGTSGVIFSVTNEHRANTGDAVHAFCHAIPNTWHHMAVMLSAANCLRWLNHLLGQPGEAILVQEAESLSEQQRQAAPIFLPYLSGERTPHNSADAAGCFLGLRQEHGRAAMTYAVMEGVAFGLRDGLLAMKAAASNPTRALLVGGGSRSAFWADLIADALDIAIEVGEDAQVGAALGAARLAQLCSEKPPFAPAQFQAICSKPRILRSHRPDSARQQPLLRRYAIFADAYKANQSIFRALAHN